MTPSRVSSLNEWSLNPPVSPTTQGRYFDLAAPVLVLGAAEQPASNATVLAAARTPSAIFLDVIGNVIPYVDCTTEREVVRGMLIQVTDTTSDRGLSIA